MDDRMLDVAIVARVVVAAGAPAGDAAADGGLLAVLGVLAALAWHHLARLRPGRSARTAS
jgi:hypothetical protein